PRLARGDVAGRREGAFALARGYAPGGWRAGSRWWRPIRAVLRLTAGGLAALGLLVLVATSTPLVSWWATALAGEWQEPGGDVLILLAGSELGDGLMGTSSYGRSVYAVRVWRESRFREVVIAGGGPGPTPVASPMRYFLECPGVPA